MINSGSILYGILSEVNIILQGKRPGIFMFVDLLSSTTIAESLGHEKYHNLLHDFYSDITNLIIYIKGEIYQYVGDEVIISWQLPTGQTNNHCLKFYFDMCKTITDLKEK